MAIGLVRGMPVRVVGVPGGFDLGVPRIGSTPQTRARLGAGSIRVGG